MLLLHDHSFFIARYLRTYCYDRPMWYWYRFEILIVIRTHPGYTTIDNRITQMYVNVWYAYYALAILWPFCMFLYRKSAYCVIHFCLFSVRKMQNVQIIHHISCEEGFSFIFSLMLLSICRNRLICLILFSIYIIQ